MYFTKRQVADTLGVSIDTVDRMVDRGSLPRPIKLSPGRSGSVRWCSDEVEAALARLHEPTP